MKQKKLVAEIKEEIQFEENQKNLKEKHHIEDPNVVVIEKNNFIKFFTHFNFLLFNFLISFN